MKLYKFRPLQNKHDFDRIVDILENGFWCEKFSELNDPMEGIFLSKSKSILNDIVSEKNKYKICSFSGEENFKKVKSINNPLLWGYYANGYKGVAIKIEPEKKEDFYPVAYTDEESFDEINENDDLKQNLKNILTRKYKDWEQEGEVRFLTTKSGNKHKVGKITKIYFGTPYEDLVNTSDIIENSKKLRKYGFWKKELEIKAKKLKIPCKDIKK